jgi:hypothetical protein
MTNAQQGRWERRTEGPLSGVALPFLVAYAVPILRPTCRRDWQQVVDAEAHPNQPCHGASRVRAHCAVLPRPTAPRRADLQGLVRLSQDLSRTGLQDVQVLSVVRDLVLDEVEQLLRWCDTRDTRASLSSTAPRPRGCWPRAG